MADTRVELRVSFTVSSDRDTGREAAEGLLRRLESLADHGEFDCYTGDFTVERGAVNGNAWHERWPDKPDDSRYEAGDSADTVRGIIARADGMTDLSGTEPLIERLAEQVRDLAEVLYRLLPKDH